jgi:hypothetical protein
MIDGLWTAKFETAQFTGGGVVLFHNGKLFGGDNGFTWIGTYSGDERLLKARVMVRNFDKGIESIFGIPGDYEMHFTGNIEADRITGTAMIAGQPQYSVGVQMTKQANL